MLFPQFLFGFAGAIGISLLAVRLRFLTVDGALAATILGTIIFGIGGIVWAIPLLAFFLSSSVLTKINSQKTRSAENISARDAWQVAANGGVACLTGFMSLAFPEGRWFLVFAGSIAAANADTWGTEIGTLLKGKAFLSVSLRPVERGTSGAISSAGTLGSIAGAILIAITTIAFIKHEAVTAAVVIAASGLVGSLTDSLIGATLQGRFRCGVCGKRIELKNHCGTKATVEGGLAWISNDGVNTACVSVGAFLVYILAP